MKRIAHSRNSIPVLAEVEPDDRTCVLECDPKAEYLRVKTDSSIEICHVEVDVGNIDWLDHVLTPARQILQHIPVLESGPGRPPLALLTAIVVPPALFLLVYRVSMEFRRFVCWASI